MKHFAATGLSLFFIICSFTLSAQVVRLMPSDPKITDTVTVYFKADEGNAALAGYKGNVYLHTGVITSLSNDEHDWKYPVGNWGKEDPVVLMKREAINIYSFRMVIKDFYRLKNEDVVRQLVFVFRNGNGTLVGKTNLNEDIVVPVNGYKPPTLAATGLNKQMHVFRQIEQTTGSWNIFTDKGRINICPYHDDILGVTYYPEGTLTADSSHSVILQPGAVSLAMHETADGYQLSSGKFIIHVQSNPFCISYYFNNQKLFGEESGFFNSTGASGVRLQLSANEKIYGGGERALPLDRRGRKLTLYNRPSYGYEFGAANLNYSMPLILSSRKYAFLFDNPQKGYADLGNTNADVAEWCTMGGTARYFVIAGKSYSDISASYTLLTGHQSLPPRWIFGNLMSRMAYRNQYETDSIVELMKQHHFPVDAVIIDFYWFGDSIQGHLGNLDWYKKAWPQPEKMVTNFSNQGIKTILITEPYIIDTVANYADAVAKGVFVTDSTGKAFVDKQFYFGAGSLIDIFKPQAREWFWQKYQKQIDMGIAAWWGDLGEPESHPSSIYHVNGKADQVHNIYGHYWDKMLFDKYAQLYPGTRLFHLQRSGFAGSQRYSAFPWTGDVSRSWGGLRAQLPLLLTMSVSGLGYIHSDAGGFAQGVKDDELYTRWLQFAAFTPVFRPHGSGIPSEPVYWSEQTQNIVRKYINLRYSMLPYNYTLAYRNATLGEPLMKPLFYVYDDTLAANREDEYLWGNEILVAPILKPGENHREVYLPAGNWYDFHTGEIVTGAKTIAVNLTISDIPLFVKAGSFIPFTETLPTTSLYKADNYRIRYYPQGESEFVQYEDDGMDNLALSTGQFELIKYKGIQTTDKVTISIDKQGSWKGMPTERKICMEIRLDKFPRLVSINGKRLKQSKKSKNSSYSFDGQWLRVYYTWNGYPTTIKIDQ